MTIAQTTYSMSAFDTAVNFLMPEIKIINGASNTHSVARPEQMRMIAYKYFFMEKDTLTEKQLEALDVVRSVGLDLENNGRLVFGAKQFVV